MAPTPQLAMYVMKTDSSTFADRQELSALVSDSELNDYQIGLQSEIPSTGPVSWSSPNLSFASSNGGSQSVTYSPTTTNQELANAIVSARWIANAKAIFLKDDSSAIANPSVDQARIMTAMSFLPTGRKVSDYLSSYSSVAGGQDFAFTNSDNVEVVYAVNGTTVPPPINGVFTNGDGTNAGTIVFGGDLSTYNLGTNTYSNFRVKGASGNTAGAFSTAGGVTTFTLNSNAVVNDAQGNALADGAMSMSFTFTDTATAAVVDTTANSLFNGTTGWYTVDPATNAYGTTASSPTAYQLVPDSSKPQLLQPAVTINSGLGTYLKTNFGNGFRDKVSEMGIGGTPTTSTLDFGSQGLLGIAFNNASLTIDAVTEIRKSFLTAPTVSQLVALGSNISLNVIFELPDASSYFIGKTFSNSNYATWAPKALDAVPEAEAGIVASPLGYYRANKTSQNPAAQVIATAIIVGSSSPTSLTTLSTFLGSSNVTVDQYDAVSAGFVSTSITPVELYSRVLSGYKPSSNLAADQWNVSELVAYGQTIGLSMNLLAIGTSGAKTTFSNLTAPVRSALAQGYLEGFVNGTKSPVVEVVEGLYAAGATSGSTDISALAYALMGGSASINSQFNQSNQNKALAQAINVYTNANPGLAGLADPLILNVLNRAGLIRQDKTSSDPWAGVNGLIIGVGSLSNGTPNNFSAPSKDANGTAWASVLVDAKVPYVSAIYGNLIADPALSFNTKEKAALLYYLIQNIIGGSLTTNVYAELEKYITDKAVFKEVFRKNGGSATGLLLNGNAGGSLPLGLAALHVKIISTAETDEVREACLDAFATAMMDFSDIQASGSTASADMLARPRASPVDLGQAIGTIISQAALSGAQAAAYIRAMVDMNAGADSAFESVGLGNVTAATYNAAVSTAIQALAAALGNYSTATPSVINANEMTASWANALRYVVSQLRSFLKHPLLDIPTLISAGTGLTTFAEGLMIMEYISDNSTISREQAQELIASGMSAQIVNGALMARPVYTGRVLQGTEFVKYIA